MKITLEPTTKIVQLNGIPARIWEGETAAGIKVHAFITRIAVAREDDASELEASLKEMTPPSPAVGAVYPDRLVL